MLRLICLLAFLAWPLASHGQEPRQLGIELTESGRAYQSTVRGVHTTVDYYDPSAPAPEMITAEPIRLDADEPREGASSYSSGETRITVTIIVVLLLIGLAIAIAKLSGVNSTSFSRLPERGTRVRRNRQEDEARVIPTSLSAIADMADRRLALIMLTAQTMQAAAAECGFRIGRSWTLRDVIRRIPRDWRHHGALTSLARAAEAAHFGGREVAEDEFQTHFAAARTIMGARA